MQIFIMHIVIEKNMKVNRKELFFRIDCTIGRLNEKEISHEIDLATGEIKTTKRSIPVRPFSPEEFDGLHLLLIDVLDTLMSEELAKAKAGTL